MSYTKCPDCGQNLYRAVVGNIVHLTHNPYGQGADTCQSSK